MADRLLKIGEYNSNINQILDIDIKQGVIFRSTGLPSHMIKRKHYNCLKYIDYIPEIIEQPDYIGLNIREDEFSIEYIRCYSVNILVAVKVDFEKDYLYVSTMYDIQNSKLERRLHSGRLKAFSKNNIDNTNET